MNPRNNINRKRKINRIAKLKRNGARNVRIQKAREEITEGFGKAITTAFNRDWHTVLDMMTQPQKP